MQKGKLVIMAVLLLALTVAACTPANGLDGTVWVLTELAGEPALDDTVVTLIISGDEIGGIDGCNHYGAEAEAAGGRFELTSPITSTLMACEQPIMDQANLFSLALMEATGYRLVGDQLVLLNANGGQLAVFQPQNG
jgi:heat shock protein HslJ